MTNSSKPVSQPPSPTQPAEAPWIWIKAINRELANLRDWANENARRANKTEAELAALRSVPAPTQLAERPTPEQLAQKFHELYETLAPQFNYTTRKASAKPWTDVPENNRNLMIAVCGEILHNWAVLRSVSTTKEEKQMLDRPLLLVPGLYEIVFDKPLPSLASVPKEEK